MHVNPGPHLSLTTKTMGKWMTIAQKRELIRKKEECPTMTQPEIADWAASEFRLSKPPAQRTVSDILRSRESIMDKAHGDGKRKRTLKVTSKELEVKLCEWVAKVESKKAVLSRALMTTKAQRLQGELGGDASKLTLSDGWLSKFMRRHGLRFRVRHGEAGSVDLAAVEAGRRRIQEVTDLYEPHNIYNMDETGMYHSMAPQRSICTKGTRGEKKNKTRMTLAMTANADGSDQLEPLFIGRARKPRCFGNKSGEQLGFNYESNKKAWMTGSLFRKWVRDRDREMRSRSRNILLLLDNASPHSIGGLVLTNVAVQMLPPNTTSFLQPMDAGIIAMLKQRYKRHQLEHAIDIVDADTSDDDLGKSIYLVDQLQAMRWSVEAWQSVQSRFVSNCFRHTRILFPHPFEDCDSNDESTDRLDSSLISIFGCLSTD